MYINIFYWVHNYYYYLYIHTYIYSIRIRYLANGQAYLELQVRICSGIVFELAVSTLMPFLTEWACGQSHKCVVLYTTVVSGVTGSTTLIKTKKNTQTVWSLPSLRRGWPYHQLSHMEEMFLSSFWTAKDSWTTTCLVWLCPGSVPLVSSAGSFKFRVFQGLFQGPAGSQQDPSCASYLVGGRSGRWRKGWRRECRPRRSGPFRGWVPLKGWGTDRNWKLGGILS